MKTEVKVGAITIASVIALTLIISFLGAFDFLRPDYEINVAYPKVVGLKEGNFVRYAGVNVGSVKKMKITPNNVLVTVGINKDVKIPTGSIFSLGTDGILGEKFVEIEPGEGVSIGSNIKENTTVQGIPGKGIDEFMEASTKVLAKVESIAEALNNVFGDAEVQKSMRDGFINARDISNNLNTFTKIMADMAAANSGEIHQMITSLNSATARMNSVAANLDNILEGAAADGKTGKNVAMMAENLAVTSQRIEAMSKTLSNVINDPKTEADLKETITNARTVSARAKKILSTFDDPKFTVDTGRNLGGKRDWRSNIGVTLEPTETGFVYMGVNDIGNNTKFDFQIGKRYDDLSLSVGAMQGEFGVGLDYSFGDAAKLYSQAYDFNSTKIKLGGEVRVADKISVFGENLDIRNSRKSNTYVGVRSHF